MRSGDGRSTGQGPMCLASQRPRYSQASEGSSFPLSSPPPHSAGVLTHNGTSQFWVSWDEAIPSVQWRFETSVRIPGSHPIVMGPTG